MPKKLMRQPVKHGAETRQSILAVVNSHTAKEYTHNKLYLLKSLVILCKEESFLVGLFFIEVRFRGSTVVLK